MRTRLLSGLPVSANAPRLINAASLLEVSFGTSSASNLSVLRAPALFVLETAGVLLWTQSTWYMMRLSGLSIDLRRHEEAANAIAAEGI